ncbi:hypothetical protein M9194_20565 [Vibrio sp. S4M6]|uniref:type III secretion system domain-containing protein n=1 Tax=Vibrio sinus TaxID=2946865 RepID=UPI00202A335E|nr:type III secretion system domain-containing protein [Vibrio sinus]MCL9783823.1 hypothetical protein [Vibrio sinus]
MALDLATASWHKLAYTPGKWMSLSWWEALELSPWKGLYPQSRQCQQALDTLICMKRGFPSDSPFLPTTQWQKTLLEDVENLPKLLTALGLIRLARPDFLMLKSNKATLQLYLPSEDLDQLLAIFPQEQFIDDRIKVQVEPTCDQNLPHLALYLGWSGLFQPDPVWQALAVVFPASFTTQEVSGEIFHLLQQWYIRLRRLL